MLDARLLLVRARRRRDCLAEPALLARVGDDLVADAAAERVRLRLDVRRQAAGVAAPLRQRGNDGAPVDFRLHRLGGEARHRLPAETALPLDLHLGDDTAAPVDDAGTLALLVGGLAGRETAADDQRIVLERDGVAAARHGL